MEDSQGSYYSNDQQYFLDLCRAGQLEELQQFVQSLKEANFDWACITNSHDNFLHMLAANNLVSLFDYLFPLVSKKIGPQMEAIINKQNSTGNSPLHYAVITDSKEMAVRLIENGANTNLLNESGRTPFAEAEQFDKIEIAQILAPITKNNLEELKKDMEILDVCNEDSSSEEDEKEEQKEPKQTENAPKKMEEYNK